jgi:hypothetical protein
VDSGTVVTAWVRTAGEGEALTVTGTVRYGDGLRWTSKTVTGPMNCNNNDFGGDPAPGALKTCEVQMTVPGVTQIAGAMPVANMALIPPPATPFTGARVRTLSASELANTAVYQPAPADVGAFRVSCPYSHMAKDDPIVFPGQPGMAHLHVFSGNSLADANSTADSLLNTGGSTCAGGTLNRTAYWMPALIDTRTGQPVMPAGTNFYYKLGYLGVKAGTVQPFPQGLRIIAGSSSATALSPVSTYGTGFECATGGRQNGLRSCAIGDSLNAAVVFPQCWDGKNLDSPDHKSHMAYATGSGCPSTHPVPLPEITLNVHYAVTEANTADFWRLSSDMYSGQGGFSLHADWFGGWDRSTMQAFITNCINANMDCHNHLLGDGRTLY